MKKAILEVLRTAVAGGISVGITAVVGNPQDFGMIIMLTPVLRGISKALHCRYPGSFWDWLPF